MANSIDFEDVRNLEKKAGAAMRKELKTKNRDMIEEYLKMNENPILKSFKHLVKRGKPPKEYYKKMLPIEVIQLMDPIMQEKVWNDLESE